MSKMHGLPDGCPADPGDCPAPDFQTDLATAVTRGVKAAVREVLPLEVLDVETTVTPVYTIPASSTNDVLVSLMLRVRTYSDDVETAALDVFGEIASHFARAR